MRHRGRVVEKRLVQKKKAMAPLRDERWTRHRAAVERWKYAHYEYYLWQKRQLATRPEYLAHRRAMYRARRSKTESIDLSTNKLLNEHSSQEQTTTGQAHTEPDAAEGPTQRDRTGTA